MIFVDRLVWDSENIAHIARHKVIPDEVEEVCHGKHIVRRTYDKRILLTGPTQSGRMLTIILGPTKKKSSYYPVTARPASNKEIRLYDEESR